MRPFLQHYVDKNRRRPDIVCIWGGVRYVIDITIAWKTAVGHVTERDVGHDADKKAAEMGPSHGDWTLARFSISYALTTHPIPSGRSRRETADGRLKRVIRLTGSCRITRAKSLN